LVVRTEEELKQRLVEGWKLYKDKVGFLLYDPLTKKKERVGKSLYHLCEYLLLKSRASEEDHAAVEEAEEAGAEREHARSRVLVEDTRLIVNTIRQKLDPKAPIIAKWTENISWWHHVIIDTATYLLPELLSMLRAEEIDLSNPEATAKHMVSKFKAIKEKVQSVEEVEAKYAAELEVLKQRVAELERRVREYGDVIAEQNRIVGELAERVKRTIAFFVLEAPNYLPEDAKTQYRILASRAVREIWGESGE
jgi:uncharacterized coiled-coil protein SlyX